MTELTSLGSQSSRLNMEHFLQLQLFLLDEAPEEGPAELAAWLPLARFIAELTRRLPRAAEGRRMSPPEDESSL